MALTKFQTDIKEFSLMQTSWASMIDPVLAMPIAGGLILKNVPIIVGSNKINHLLGRKLQGWFPVRWRNSWAQIYDTQDQNQMPSLTLALTSSGVVNIDLFVF